MYYVPIHCTQFVMISGLTCTDSSNKEDDDIGMTTSLSGVTPISQDASESIDVNSATNNIIINGPVSNRNNNASIDSWSGSVVYIITGVVIAIIVLGILAALVTAVLFMKARYTLIMTLNSDY